MTGCYALIFMMVCILFSLSSFAEKLELSNSEKPSGTWEQDILFCGNNFQKSIILLFVKI